MDELHERPRTPVPLGVPEERLDRRIHPLPVTVEPCEDDHLRSEREVPLDLGHGLSMPASRKGEHAGDGGESEPRSEHEPRVPRRIHPRQHESGSSPPAMTSSTSAIKRKRTSILLEPRIIAPLVRGGSV
jgi:hypothetical protein